MARCRCAEIAELLDCWPSRRRGRPCESVAQHDARAAIRGVIMSRIRLSCDHGRQQRGLCPYPQCPASWDTSTALDWDVGSHQRDGAARYLLSGLAGAEAPRTMVGAPGGIWAVDDASTNLHNTSCLARTASIPPRAYNRSRHSGGGHRARQGPHQVLVSARGETLANALPTACQKKQARKKEGGRVPRSTAITPVQVRRLRVMRGISLSGSWGPAAGPRRLRRSRRRTWRCAAF